VRAAIENNRAIALELLQGASRPSAVFVWTDSVAITLMSAADELGMRIPEDIAVAAYDNSRPCTYSQISLTSIDQDGHRLGERAAELLIERIEGRCDEVHFVTPPQLVVRRSSRLRVA
jgi:LacI family transcriptional regulator